MGYIFKYASGETKYLYPNYLINKINGSLTTTTSEAQRSVYIISKKINRPPEEITFKDIEKKIEELNYGDNFNKLLLLNKDYLDAILYLIVDGSLRMDDYDKIVKAESSEERKFLIINLLKKTGQRNRIFKPFLNHIPVKNDSTTNIRIPVNKPISTTKQTGATKPTIIMKPTSITEIPKSTIGLVVLPYTFPKVSDKKIVNDTKTLGTSKFIGNPKPKANFKFNKAEKTQSLLGGSLKLRASTKRYFTTQTCIDGLNTMARLENDLNNTFAVIGEEGEKDTTPGGFSSTNLKDLTELSSSNIEMKYLKIHKNNGWPIEYYILQNRSDESVNKTMLDSYNSNITYYKRNEDGSYAEVKFTSANKEKEYNEYPEPLYRKCNGLDLIPSIGNFGAGIRYSEVERFIDDIDEDFDESRVYNDKDREEYKQELIAKIEENKDSLESSLYNPVLIDALKNYVDWLFTDDFYVDGELSLVFPYYISSECAAYLGVASTVKDTVTISERISHILKTKGNKRILNAK